jgi:NAD dependent epimerase/dehydratase family enzyme
MNRLFECGLSDNSWSGVYIASSPNPVSQKAFMTTLRSVLGIPFGLPAAEWMVRIAAPLLLRTDPELVLYGRYVNSQRLKEGGFDFRFPQLREALENVLK